jgi:hypothetical protein
MNAISSIRQNDSLIKELCRRVTAGNRKALGELAEYLLPVLTSRLRRTYRHAPSDLLIDACVDAILEYGFKPTRFDSSRGVPLESFLQLAAARNLANSLKADSRRRQREAIYAQERLRTTVVLPSVDQLSEEDIRARVLRLVAEGVERAALEAWLAGERSYATLAATLGMSGRYDCQVTVLDPASSKAAFWHAPIAVVP